VFEEGDALGVVLSAVDGEAAEEEFFEVGRR